MKAQLQKRSKLVYSQSNIETGLILELTVKFVFYLSGYRVVEHRITEGGVDVEAYKKERKVVVECLNWNNNPYVNEDRFKKIVKNLLSHREATKVLVLAGPHLTESESKLVKAYNIKLVKMGRTMNCSDLKSIRLLAKRMSKEGVIDSNPYYYLSIPLFNKNLDRLPRVYVAGTKAVLRMMYRSVGKEPPRQLLRQITINSMKKIPSTSSRRYYNKERLNETFWSLPGSR